MDAAIHPADRGLIGCRREAGKLRVTPGRKSDTVVNATSSEPSYIASTVAAAPLNVLWPET